MRSQVEFIRQQGISECGLGPAQDVYTALMFQPRAVAGVLLAGMLLQHPVVFLLLGGVLWWSAIVPTRNPFDAVFNRLYAPPRHLPPIPVAPEPRRFAQGLAGSMVLGIGAALLAGAGALAWTLEGLLSGAVAAVLFGRFCAGSYVYHLLQSPGLVRQRSVRHK